VYTRMTHAISPASCCTLNGRWIGCDEPLLPAPDSFVIRASGPNIVIMRRQFMNSRIPAVGFLWAFATMARTGPPKDHYD
jgi:hypothetical protein